MSAGSSQQQQQQPARKKSLAAKALNALGLRRKSAPPDFPGLITAIPADKLDPKAFADYVLIVRCKPGEPKASGKVLALINECRQVHDPFTSAKLGLYSSEEAHSEAFKRVFAGDLHQNLPFNAGILYKHHPNEKRHDYYAIDDFDHEMWKQQIDEMFDISRHIQAFTVQSSVKRSTTTANSDAVGASATVPVYVPASPMDGNFVAGGPSVSRTRARDASTTEEVLFTWKHNGLEPGSHSLPPAEAPAEWYWYHSVTRDGHLISQNLEHVVATALSCNYDTKFQSIELVKTDMTAEAYAFNLALAVRILGKASSGETGAASTTSQEFAGIAFDRNLKHRTAVDVHYKFELEFFDKEVYKSLYRRSATEQMEFNRQLRRYSGELATMRWRNFRVEEDVRPDIALHKLLGYTTKPWLSESTRHRHGPSWTVGDLLGEQPGPDAGGSNTLRIPITLYGPANAGKSSVLATWQTSSHDSPYAFMTQTWHDFQRRVRDTGMRSSEADLIITSAIFSNDLGPEAPAPPESWDKDYPGPRVEGREFTDAEEAAFKRFDYLTVAFKDSRPAVSYMADDKGRALPFGLQVLVLNAVDVFELSQLPADDAGRIDALKGWEALFCTKLRGEKAFEEYKVYPPLAIILAQTNRVAVPNGQDPVTWFKAAVGEMTKMLVERFDCDAAHVLPMDTFAVPTDEEVQEYRRLTLLETSKSNREMAAIHRRWRSVMKSALSALQQLMALIRSKETESLEIVLATPVRDPAQASP